MKKKQRISRVAFKTRPYMQELDEKTRRQYLVELDVHTPEENEEYLLQMKEDVKCGINLANHVGQYKPIAPAFGVPLMNYKENPLEKVRNDPAKLVNFEDLDFAKQEIVEYEAQMCRNNWRMATGARNSMRG